MRHSLQVVAFIPAGRSLPPELLLLRSLDWAESLGEDKELGLGCYTQFGSCMAGTLKGVLQGQQGIETSLLLGVVFGGVEYLLNGG